MTWQPVKGYSMPRSLFIECSYYKFCVVVSKGFFFLLGIFLLNQRQRMFKQIYLIPKWERNKGKRKIESNWLNKRVWNNSVEYERLKMIRKILIKQQNYKRGKKE